MTEPELTYHEVLTALPAYVTGILRSERQAAIDDYLQRQIALFRHLDELEAAAALDEQAEKTDGRAQQPTDAFAQMMEGESGTQQLANNPLLMRNAPQTYTDRRTGQRFVVPKRGTLQEERAPRNFPAPPLPWSERLRRAIWNILAVATIIAVLLIGAYQVQLQRQLTAAKDRTMLMSEAEQVLLLSATTTPSTMRGTFFRRGQRALLALTDIEPPQDSQVYQFWYRTESGDQYNGGIIEPNEEETAHQLLLELPVDVTAIVHAGLTIEAAGGRATPTLPMVIEAVQVEK